MSGIKLRTAMALMAIMAVFPSTCGFGLHLQKRRVRADAHRLFRVPNRWSGQRNCGGKV